MKSLLVAIVGSAVITPILFAFLVVKGMPLSWDLFLAIYGMCVAAFWFLTVRDKRAEEKVNDGRKLLAVNIMSTDPLVKVICSDETLAFTEEHTTGQSLLVHANWILRCRNSVTNTAVCSLTVSETVLPDDLRKEVLRLAIATCGGSFLRPLVVGLVLYDEGSSTSAQQLVDNSFAGRGGIGWVIRIQPSSRRVDACQTFHHLSSSNVYALLLQHLREGGCQVEATVKASLLSSIRTPQALLFEWFIGKWTGKK